MLQHLLRSRAASGVFMQHGKQQLLRAYASCTERMQAARSHECPDTQAGGSMGSADAQFSRSVGRQAGGPGCRITHPPCHLVTG